MLAPFALAIVLFSALHLAIALILCGPPALVVLATLEPMRYLQLVYIFLALIGGAFIGRYFLKTHPVRWIAFLLVFNAPMFLVQRHLFASTPHIELPSADPGNPWLEAFTWVRLNTPRNAYFAAAADNLTRPSEDMHSFRALAERSILADDIKDRSVLSKAPGLVPEWRRQVDAQRGWDGFDLAGFQRLKSTFGADWVILDRPAPPGLPCPWTNQRIRVCRVP